MLRTCKEVRGKLGVRWEPTDDLPPCKRLQACIPGGFDEIAKSIERTGHGFYCAEVHGMVPLVMYAAFVGAAVWSTMLRGAECRVYFLDMGVPLCTVLSPLSDLLATAGVTSASTIARFTTVTMEFLQLDNARVFWQVESCAKPKEIDIAKEPSGGDVDVSDSDLEDSDAESVYSVADSGVEPEDDDNDEHDGNEDAEVGNAGDLHAPELGQRLPGGTWVVWSNG